MKTIVILCAFLHIILALIYVIVLVHAKAEFFNKPLYLSEDTARTAVTVITQGFTIAYCAMLVFFTQRIALYEIIAGQQTLSAIHDKSAAWLGLVSAFSVLSNQAKITTDLAGVLFITIYLTCILVVHTTLPGTFSLAVVNVTADTAYPTTLARQTNIMDSFGEYNPSIHSILSIYDTLDITTVGIWNNMIYDIIPVVSDTANAAVAVNATTISVDCGPIPDIVQTAFQANGSLFSPSKDMEDNAAYDFTFGGGKYTASIVPMILGEVQVVAPMITPSTEDDGTVIDYTTGMLLVVSTGVFAIMTEASLTPAQISISPPWQAQQDVTTGVDILGCNFAITNSTVPVNAQSREVTKSTTASAPAAWKYWTDPGSSSDPLLAQALMPFGAYAPLDGSNSALEPIVVLTNTTNLTTSSLLSMLDVFLLSDMLHATNGSYNALAVEDLNRSLAKAYAAVLWYNNVMNSADGSPIERQQGEALIPIVALQVRIVINTLSLAIGLGAFCVLLILVAILIFRTRHSRRQHGPLIDSTGLLPMIWLLSNEPRLMDVQEPDLNALRAAGMYEVPTMATRRRARSSKEDMNEVDESSEQLGLYAPLITNSHVSPFVDLRV